ncbi:hypothetical protein VTO73DRAFT_11870 [Trametes versicolor]
MSLIHDIQCDFDRRILQSDIPAFPLHVLVRYEVCYDHRDTPEFDVVLEDAKRWLEDYPRERLQKGVEEGDAACILESCLRKMSQCQPGTDRLEDTLRNIERVSGLCGEDGEPNRLPPVINNTELLQKRALAAWAWWFFQMYFIRDPGASLHAITVEPAMLNAACCANECAHQSFLPPIVLRIAAWLSTVKPRFGVDVRAMPKFKEFTFLWVAYAIYQMVAIEREEDRLEKVAKAPHEYRCAADGCGIQVYHRDALRKCGGNCPPETKPRYCGYWCQVKHWFVHQYVCKKGLAVDPIIDDDGDPDWIDDETYDTTYWDQNGIEDELVWGYIERWEFFIDIEHPSPYRKGEVYRIRSKTLSPEFLRSYRWYWKLPSDDRVFQERRLGVL